MSLLLELPPDLFQNALENWLFMQGLVRLDSAMGSNRSGWLEKLHFVRCNSAQENVSFRVGLMDWLQLRGIPCSDAFIYQKSEIQKWPKYLKTTGCFIRKVELRNLVTLDIGAILTAMSKYCKHLEELECISCKLNETLFTALGKCLNLKHLRINYCTSVDAPLQSKQACLQVSSVILLCAGVSPWIIALFHKFTHLTELHLIGQFANSNVSNLVLSLAQLPMLRRLRLQFHALADADLFVIGQRSPHLVLLDIASKMNVNHSITDLGIVAVCRCLQHVQTLDLSYTLITEESLSAIGQHCRQSLQRLYLHQCNNISLSAVRSLLKDCPLITALGVTSILSWSSNDKSLQQITSLSVPHVSLLFLAALPTLCPKLKRLHTATAEFARLTGLEEVVAFCTQLSILRIECRSSSDFAIPFQILFQDGRGSDGD